MFACLHVPGQQVSKELLDLALQFSPEVERTSNATVVFPIAPLRKLIGSPYQIASEICRFGYECKLQANLSIASNPDTAILLARHYMGVTLVTPGEERLKLGPLPLATLVVHNDSIPAEIIDVFCRWGVKTCEDLAALPESGVAERLGEAGVYLHKLACGTIDRPLRLAPPITSFEETMELEYPISLLEPLLFLFGRVIQALCQRLRSQSQAARRLQAQLELEGQKQYSCQLEFPTPLTEAHTLLKLLQLHLDRHPPEASIIAFTLRVEPVDPSRVQGGIFVPATPAPDKLHLTLARIAAMVGQESVGTPVLLNTHRPDAFAMAALNTSAAKNANTPNENQHTPLRLVIRLFRPALQAHVTVKGIAPKEIRARGVQGSVMRCAGPWKTSGEWWLSSSLQREEWDVALDDGVLYRIYQDRQAREWYVQGVYD